MDNITYTAVRSPKWLNQAHTYLECEVNFDHLDDEWVAFTCVPTGSDVHKHTGKIFAECVAGDYGTIAEFNIPEADLSEGIRAIRDELLTKEVDPIVTNPLRWNSLTTEKQQEWTNYRQNLLDFPDTTTATVKWNDIELGFDWVNLDLPVKPEA